MTGSTYGANYYGKGDWRNGLTREQITQTEQDIGRALVVSHSIQAIKKPPAGRLKLFARLAAKLPQGHWELDWQAEQRGDLVFVTCGLPDGRKFELQEEESKFPSEMLIGQMLLLL